MNILVSVSSLVNHMIENKIIEELDYDYSVNKIIEILKIKEYKKPEEKIKYIDAKKNILDYAITNSVIANNVTNKDNLIAEIMDVFLELPSKINEKFYEKYKISPKKSTDYLYNLMKKVEYIKEERTNKNKKWTYKDVAITINLAKPEKTPEEIKAEKEKKTGYPKCFLCKENVGTSINILNARQNLRIIEMNLNETEFYFQYSPYSYFNEHAIIFSKSHTPLVIDSSAIKIMTDFLDILPHYCIGANAGLEIVGGSILSHNHFQAGNVVMPIEKKEAIFQIKKGEITLEVIDWHLNAIRIKGKDKKKINEVVSTFINHFSNYSNEKLKIKKENNALNIFARKNEEYIITLIPRNNLTDKLNPYGVFNTKEKNFHIKKENIGIIEVLGIAILPKRLDLEFNKMLDYLKEEDNSVDTIHKDWLDKIRKNNFEYNKDYLKEEIAKVFIEILEDVSVFKNKNELIQFVLDFKEIIN